MQNLSQPSFRAALQGAAVGELVGSGYLTQFQSHQALDLSRFSPVTEEQGSLPGLLPWIAQVVEWGEQGLAALEPIVRQPEACPRLNGPDRSRSVSGTVLVAFPFLMLFHDQPVAYARYRDWLLLAADPEARIVLDSMRWAIAATLQTPSPAREPWSLLTLLQDAPLEETPSLSWQAVLHSVQSLVQQQAGLTQASRSLIGQPVALKPLAIALYCFLSTPQDFRLSVLRAAYLAPDTASLTCALVGMLSGAYNRYSMIPTAWMVALENEPWALLNQRLQMLAYGLWSAWTGIEQARGEFGQEEAELLVVFPRRLTLP